MRITVFIVLFSITSNLYSQINDNKISLSIGGSFGYMVNSNYVTSENLILPSLYAGFKNVTSFDISGHYRITKDIYGGLGLSIAGYKKWNIPDENLYNSSEINKKNIALSIRFINPLSGNSGTKIFYYTQFALNYGPEKLILRDIMTERSGQEEMENIETTIYSSGGSASIGFAYRMAGTRYIFMETGYSHSRSDSYLTMNDRMNKLYVQAGILFILSMEKQYYY